MSSQDIEIFEDIEQGSPLWHEFRRGIVTTSNLSSVMAESKEMAMRTKYLRRLVIERFSGKVMETFKSARMDDGHRQEPLIRNAYAFLTGQEPTRVGFVRRTLSSGTIVGCSPDSFLGEDGILEIKSADPDILLGFIESDKFPPVHKHQVQGGLWVCKRRWAAIAIGCFPEDPPPNPFPIFIKTVERDEAYIGEVSLKVEKFDREVGESLKRFLAYVPD